ncbi:hypothetical protein QTP70_031077, partial [Hemibagrus guttatus]
TQGFPAEHCPKYDTASAGLPSSHSASWCYVFPRTSINIFSNLSNSSSSVGSDHTGQSSFPTCINESCHNFEDKMFTCCLIYPTY